MKYKSRWSGLTVLACAAVFIGSTAALGGCSGQASSSGTGSQSGGDPAQVEFFAMDTYMTLTAYATGGGGPGEGPGPGGEAGERVVRDRREQRDLPA